MKFSLSIISLALIASVVAAAPVADVKDLTSRNEETQEFISPYNAVFRRGDDDDDDDAQAKLKSQKQSFISPYKYVFRRDDESTEFIPAGKFVFRRDASDALESQKLSWINPKGFVFRRAYNALFGGDKNAEKRTVVEVTDASETTSSTTSGFINANKYVY